MSTGGNDRCVYYNCSNSRKNKEISFFKFPAKDIKRVEEWKKNCGNISIALKENEHLVNKKVCEKHFSDSAVMMQQNRKVLRKYAIPIQYVQGKFYNTDYLNILAIDTANVKKNTQKYSLVSNLLVLF